MRWKWVLIAVAVLVVAAVVAVYVIVSSYDFNDLKPVISRTVMDATGRELKMGGDIKLGIGFTPTLFVENVSFQNAPWGSRPELATVKRFEVQVALLPLISREIEIRRLILIEPDILLETDASGNSNLKFEGKPDEGKPKEAPPVEEEIALPSLTFDEVRIENGKLTYKDGKSDTTHAIILESLKAAAPRKDRPAEIALVMKYNEKPLELGGTIGPISKLTDPTESWPLKLTVKAGGATVGIDGGIKDVMNARGIDVKVTAETASLPETARLADISGIPDLGAFKMAARATDPAAKTYKLSDMEIMLGENDLAGSVEVNLAGARPHLTAALTSKKIDLRSLLPEDTTAGAEKEEAAEPAEKKDKIFPDDPLPLDVMRLVDADASIKAKQILLPRLALDDVSAEIVLKDGALVAKPIKAGAGGGSFDGRLNLRAQGETADLDTTVKIEQLDLGRMLVDLGITEMLEGILDADINLTGSGRSVADLMAGLNGKTKVVMGSGRINNKYIDLLGVDLSSGALRLLNPLGEQKKYTELNCFVSGFDIRDGVAESTALVLDTNNMSIIGDGQINLATEKLNFSLKPSPKKGSSPTEVAGVSLSLGELAKPFKLGGTLAKPKLAIDATQSALIVGKAVGGTMLLGPVGIAAALATKTQDDENPCLAAIEAAESGVKLSGGETAEPDQSAIGQVGEGLSESTKGAVEEAGKTLKKLFGN